MTAAHLLVSKKKKKIHDSSGSYYRGNLPFSRQRLSKFGLIWASSLSSAF